MAWVVEMAGYDTVAGATKTLRFAQGEGISFTDVAYAPGALANWESASQRVDFNKDGEVEMGSGGGIVTIANYPDSNMEAGPFDQIATWIWHNSPATLYWVPGQSWAARIRVASGVLEQPVANLSTTKGIDSTISFPIRDPRAALETPFQPVLYLGNNVGPTGLEGGTELKGRPKPIVYGLVSNMSPPLVNESRLIYQIADKPVNVLCVRDGAVSLGAGTLRATLQNLIDTGALSGKFDVYRGAEGTFIKLGTTPIYNLTCDVDEAPNVAGQSHAQIWKRIRTDRIGGVLNAASITAADAIDANGAGFYWGNEITQKEVIAEVMRSFSGYEVQDASGSWSIAKMLIPSGTPVIELEQITRTTRKKLKTRALTSLSKVRPSYAPNGAPPFRVNVKWGRNYTIMNEANFAGVAKTRLRQKFAEEYRSVSASSNAIWNPQTKTGLWPNAPELTVRTAYQPDADGLGSSAPQAEANRLLALLSGLRGQYQATCVPEIGDQLLPGQVVRLTYPRYGLSAGALFRVIEPGLTVNDKGARLDMVIGLQV